MFRLLLLGALAATIAAENVMYVAQGGTVNSCTDINNPCDSLATAVNAGQGLSRDIIVFPGVYSGSKNVGLTLPTYITAIQGKDPNNATIFDAQGASRIFNIDASATIKISDITFRNGHTTDSNGGGALLVGTASNIIISGCIFNKNDAEHNGGAVSILDGSTVNISKCNMTSNTASGGGAVSMLGNNNNLNIADSFFVSNTAETQSSNGGAVEFGSGTLTLTNDYFQNNRASATASKAVGGAVHVSAAAALSVTACTFLNNAATASAFGLIVSGGAIAIDDAATSVSITGSTFTGNTAVEGGAISTLTVMTLSGSTFTSNSVSSKQSGHGGGAISVNVAGSTTITSCSFNKNTAQGSGGAIFLQLGTVSISGPSCSFIGNQVSTVTFLDGGGALASSPGPDTWFDVTGCEFISNVATGSPQQAAAGGAINVQNPVSGPSHGFAGCVFTSNVANNGVGGAVYTNGINSFLNNCVFTNNRATGSQQGGGGAVLATGGTLSVMGSGFSNNAVTGPYGGGAVYVANVPFLDVQGAGFSGNSAMDGGAVFIDSSDSSFLGCIFNSNKAVSSGGAIASNGESLTVTNGNFTSNAVSSPSTNAMGGAISMSSPQTEQGNLTVTAVVFTSNAATSSDATASGGAISSVLTYVAIRGCAFSSNTVTGSSGANGGAVAITGGTQVNLLNSCGFNSNDAKVDGDNAPLGGAVYGSGTTVQLYGSSTLQDNMVNDCVSSHSDQTSGVAIAPSVTVASSCAVSSCNCDFCVAQSSCSYGKKTCGDTASHPDFYKECTPAAQGGGCDVFHTGDECEKISPGGGAIIAFIIIGVFAAAGGGFFLWRRRRAGGSGAQALLA